MSESNKSQVDGISKDASFFCTDMNFNLTTKGLDILFAQMASLNSSMLELLQLCTDDKCTQHNKMLRFLKNDLIFGHVFRHCFFSIHHVQVVSGALWYFGRSGWQRGCGIRLRPTQRLSKGLDIFQFRLLPRPVLLSPL